MISDLDETIKQILIKKGQLGPPEVDITFGIPNRTWSASLSKPAVSIYLYDIRENLDLRSMEWIVSRSGNNTATKKVNAKRINLTYLVTVWASNIEDQHNLLWRVMVTLYQYPTLSGDILVGQLSTQDYPITTRTAPPEELIKNPADFWAALGNEISPSFNYIVTLPMDLDIAFTSAVTRTRVLSVKPPDAEAEMMIGISGKVYHKGKPEKVITGAMVTAKEAGQTCLTDDKGWYSFSRIPNGKQTILVQLPNKSTKEFSLNVPDKDYNLEV
jgi:hypothetical protein